MPAVRLGDMHVCPMWTAVIPHGGGPIKAPCAPTVLLGSTPAARVTDLAVCGGPPPPPIPPGTPAPVAQAMAASCAAALAGIGPPDVIALGSFKVLISGLPAARMGDLTAHGGSIVIGLPTVLIG
jgi:uncharacterized Zn-binding protein involved in type VI secretion